MPRKQHEETPTPTGKTPFERFEELARKIVQVPKEKAQEPKQKKPAAPST
jgi:hypothetical protein